jgi:hypothetical protein
VTPSNAAATGSLSTPRCWVRKRASACCSERKHGSCCPLHLAAAPSRAPRVHLLHMCRHVQICAALACIAQPRPQRHARAATSGYARMNSVSGQFCTAASVTPATFAAPAIGTITQKTNMPTMARGTVSASMIDSAQRGAKTGASVSALKAAAAAPAPDETPRLASPAMSVRIVAAQLSMCQAFVVDT